MRISNIFQAKYKERPNRFTVVFEANGKRDMAHLRDPGRLKELLLPDVSLLLRPALNPMGRKTKYDVIAVWSEGIWVLINSGFHSDLAAEIIESGLIPELSGYQIEKREYTYGNSRIDFLLILKEDRAETNKNQDNKNNRLLLEVKGCTLVEENHAKFPDAPTLRGKKHVEELIKAKEDGMKAAVLFIIPREDPEVFSPNWEMDPDFSRALEKAEEQGVIVIAYSYCLNYDKNELKLRPQKRVEVRIRSRS